MGKRILFVSETPPKNTIASSVLFYRHLLLLERDGYEINILVHGNSLQDEKIPHSWNIKSLPVRRWWYPPYKQYGILKWTRYIILTIEASYFIRRTKPDIIIGFLDGLFYSGFVAFLARIYRKPLALFYHDRMEVLRYSKNSFMQKKVIKHNSYIINKANKIWTVSPDLKYNKEEWKDKFQVVYPVPEIISIKATWKDKFRTNPVIGYAGSLYNEVVDTLIILGKALNKVNGSLLLMSHLGDNLRKIKSQVQNTIIIDRTETTKKACEFMVQNASAFIVAYPEDMNVMPWIDSCFPSKFTQFIQTGLPMLVLAPEKAAISKWCIENNWIGYENNYSKQSLERYVENITKKDLWIQMSNQSTLASEIDFNQESIQSIIERDIMKLTTNQY